LIVWHCEGISKANFLDKAEVMQTAQRLVRRGVVVCVICAGALVVHGCYKRRCLDENGGSNDGWIAQGHCSACGVYPAIAPSFIKPHKHYKADVIERVVKHAEAGKNVEGLGGCAADISTMRRWIKEWGERAEWAVGCLISKLPAMRKEYICSLDLQNMTLQQQLARLLSEYPASERGGIIGNVNIILTTHNCGFL